MKRVKAVSAVEVELGLDLQLSLNTASHPLKKRYKTILESRN